MPAAYIALVQQDVDKMHARYLRFRAVRPFAGFPKPVGSSKAAPAVGRRCWPSSWAVRQPANEENFDIESNRRPGCEPSTASVLAAVCFTSRNECNPDMELGDGSKMALNAGPIFPSQSVYGASQAAQLECKRTPTAADTLSDITSQTEAPIPWMGGGGALNPLHRHVGLSGGSSGFVRLMRLSTRAERMGGVESVARIFQG